MYFRSLLFLLILNLPVVRGDCRGGWPILVFVQSENVSLSSWTNTRRHWVLQITTLAFFIPDQPQQRGIRMRRQVHAHAVNTQSVQPPVQPMIFFKPFFHLWVILFNPWLLKMCRWRLPWLPFILAGTTTNTLKQTPVVGCCSSTLPLWPVWTLSCRTRTHARTHVHMHAHTHTHAHRWVPQEVWLEPYSSDVNTGYNGSKRSNGSFGRKMNLIVAF